MPIVTISRGSYHRAKSVAEKLSARLGYECISRDDVIEKLGDFQLPGIQLVRNLHDAFSVLDRFPGGKEHFVTAIRSAILDRVLSDDVIYHGLAGHHFLQGVSHVLRVRVVSDTESRVAQEVGRSGMAAADARRLLLTDDEERRKWCMLLYGIDIVDPLNYHLVVRVDPMTEEDAVEVIAAAARSRTFLATEASRGKLTDLATAARVRYALFEFPSAAVTAAGGAVQVVLKAPENQKEAIRTRVEAILEGLDLGGSFHLQIDPFY